MTADTPQKGKTMKTQCTVCGKKLDGREFHSHTHVMINKSELAALEAVADAARKLQQRLDEHFQGTGEWIEEEDLRSALASLAALKGAE